MAWAPRRHQRLPAPLVRWQTTVLQLASTIPEAIGQAMGGKSEIVHASRGGTGAEVLFDLGEGRAGLRGLGAKEVECGKEGCRSLFLESDTERLGSGVSIEGTGTEHRSSHVPDMLAGMDVIPIPVN